MTITLSPSRLLQSPNPFAACGLALSGWVLIHDQLARLYDFKEEALYHALSAPSIWIDDSLLIETIRRHTEPSDQSSILVSIMVCGRLKKDHYPLTFHQGSELWLTQNKQTEKIDILRAN